MLMSNHNFIVGDSVIWNIDGREGSGYICAFMGYGDDVALVADLNAIGMPINVAWLKRIGSNFDYGERYRIRYLEKFPEQVGKISW